MINKNATIKVKANHQQRTFTIRKYQDGRVYVKYRTLKMNKEEFEENLNNTENDWQQYLKTDEYYKI